MPIGLSETKYIIGVPAELDNERTLQHGEIQYVVTFVGNFLFCRSILCESLPAAQ